MDNALKFTPPQVRSLLLLKKGKMVHISIEDSGIGIPLDSALIYSEILSDRSVHKTQTWWYRSWFVHLQEHRGEAHKGKIWIESEEKKGTTVHVLLPILQDGA